MRYTPSIAAWLVLSLVCLCGAVKAQEVMTDKESYASGATVTIQGTNFHPTETVSLKVIHTDGKPSTGAGHEPWTVTTDSSGAFTTTWVLATDDSAGSAFRLTATCQHTGEPLKKLEASWEFREETLLAVFTLNRSWLPSFPDGIGIESATGAAGKGEDR